MVYIEILESSTVIIINYYYYEKFQAYIKL